MAQTPMYAAMANSPGTELSADITALDTEITVLDASKLPSAPNLLTVGSDETAETILYTGKSGNSLTGCTRGFNGTAAKGWSTGAKVARNFTGYDHDTFIANINDLDTRITTAQDKADAAETPAGAQEKANEAQQAAEDYADQKDALFKADYIRQPAFASTTGSATAYTVTLDPAPSSVPDGFGITIVPHVDSGTSPTLSINGLTAVPLKKQDGSAAELKAGKPYSFRKVGTDFLANSGQGGGANVNGQKEVIFEYGETISQYDPVHVPVVFSSASVSSDIPSNSRWIAANSDNVHVAVGVQIGNYLEIYKRNSAGTGYDKLTSPPSPGAMPNRLVWSDDGQHLYVGLSDAPYFVIYKLSGDTLTKLPAVSNPPTSGINSLATNGNLVVLSMSTSPFFFIYKRNGDSFTKLSNPSVLPPNAFISSAFSSDGLVFAVCPTGSPYLILYSVSNDVFTKIADPSTLPTERINVAFSSDDYLFGSTYSSATTINVISYKRTGTDFAYTSDSISVTVATSSSSLIALTNVFGLFALRIANNVYAYRRKGSKLYPTLINLTGNLIQSIEFTADAQFFFIGNATVAPYFTAYKTIDKVRKVTSAASVMSPIYAGYAKESGVAGDKKTIVSIFN